MDHLREVLKTAEERAAAARDELKHAREELAQLDTALLPLTRPLGLAESDGSGIWPSSNISNRPCSPAAPTSLSRRNTIPVDRSSCPSLGRESSSLESYVQCLSISERSSPSHVKAEHLQAILARPANLEELVDHMNVSKVPAIALLG